jgi:hypothetical protein
LREIAKPKGTGDMKWKDRERFATATHYVSSQVGGGRYTIPRRDLTLAGGKPSASGSTSSTSGYAATATPATSNQAPTAPRPSRPISPSRPPAKAVQQHWTAEQWRRWNSWEGWIQY